MARYLIGVTFSPGAEEVPMEEWTREEVAAHLNYYQVLAQALVASGELVESTILTGPDLAHIVRSDGRSALISAVPGRHGVPTQQPVHLRRVMDEGPGDPSEMEAYLQQATRS